MNAHQSNKLKKNDHVKTSMPLACFSVQRNYKTGKFLKKWYA